MDLTIVIPAHNEEGIIIKTLESLKKEVKIPHKIIVVNDCSTDKTEEVVKEYIKKNKNITLVRTTPKRRGFANALEKGFSQVKRGAIIPVMADLCDEPKTINKMFQKLEQGWDIVCGSRYMKGGKKSGGPVLQHHLSKYVCLSLKLLTGVPTTDISNAFKMYKKEILTQAKINQKSGVESSMETTLQLYFKGANITEVPTSWKGRTVGKSKFKMLERTPRYAKIYKWALENGIRKRLRLKLKSFYA